MNYIKQISFLLGTERGKIPAVLILFVVLSCLDLLGIGLLGSLCALLVNPDLSVGLSTFVGQFAPDIVTNYQQLTIFVSVLLVGVFLIKAVFGLLIQRFIFRFCFSLQVSMQKKLMHLYQQMLFVDYIEQSSSDYITRLQAYVRTYTIGVMLPLLKTAGEVTVGLFILSFLAFLNWRDFLILLVFFGLIGSLYTILFKKHLFNLGQRTNEGWNLTVKAIQEGLGGMREIRLLKKESYFLNQLEYGATLFAANNARYSLIVSAPRYLFEMAVVLVFTYFILIAIYRGEDVVLVIPTLAMYAAAGIRFLPIATGVTTSISQLAFSRHAITSLYVDWTRESKSIVRKEVSNFNKNIRQEFSILTVSDIEFTYPLSNLKVLNKLSIEVRRGSIIGISGSTGGGKSTLISILLGLIRPDKGEVRFNSQPLPDVLDEWWSHVAYVPQEVFLVNDTLRANVALGEKIEDVDNDWLISCLSAARILEFVSGNSEGLDVRVGENGVNLSGGQRQRLAIARALYFKRDVLVFDEATSALDSKTEQAVIDELVELGNETTIIFVAHRETTLAACDLVYQIENGQAVLRC